MFFHEDPTAIMSGIYRPEHREELINFTKGIIQTINQHYRIDYDDLLETIFSNNFEREQSSSDTSYSPSSSGTSSSSDGDDCCCRALLKSNERCSRKASPQGDGFCLTHKKMYDAGKLKTFMSDASGSKQAVPSTSNSDTSKKKQTIVLEAIQLNNNNYLFDYATRRLYTNNTKKDDVPQLIGRLDDNNTIIPFSTP